MMDSGCEQDVCEVYARRIQVFWRARRDRKVFKLLMSTARSAEECLTPAVLRQLSPREANLLKDQSLQCKVRIRFSGPQFPPVIVFKIFQTGRGGRYLSGKNVFQPSNQATVDSCRMMGNRKFMDLMQQDEVHWQGRIISRPADVTCIRDYMQYSSHLDLSPVAPPPSAVSTRGPRTPKRRSPQARTLTDRMRRVYTLRGTKTVKDGDQVINVSERRSADEECVFFPAASEGVALSDVSDCEWEEEAELLCSWSNQLTLDWI
ncbi:uncharacterized protein CXorf58 homolog [Clarias gariepinus]|uniref:uncharacterized protein CXorf58 homolog n=1 Tax=Clarias gariepinus TaxID=13013 RepID=UPI00234CE6E0|nr:uncharacterized protein CXorf58 homolog [Clarias gariepinus]